MRKSGGVCQTVPSTPLLAQIVAGYPDGTFPVTFAGKKLDIISHVIFSKTDQKPTHSPPEPLV